MMAGPSSPLAGALLLCRFVFFQQGRFSLQVSRSQWVQSLLSYTPFVNEVPSKMHYFGSLLALCSAGIDAGLFI
jgi:hypothetical protein